MNTKPLKPSAERRAWALSAAALVARCDCDEVMYRYPPASAPELAEAARLADLSDAMDAEVERLVPDPDERGRVHAEAHAWIYRG